MSDETSRPTAKTRHSLDLIVLLVSILISTIVVVGGYFWHRYQLKRIASVFLMRSQEFEDKSEWQVAATYVQNYLQLRPDDAAQYIRLAHDIDEWAKQLPESIKSRGQFEAIQSYYRAIGKVDEDAQLGLRRRLVTLLIANDRFAEAERETHLIREHFPNDPDVLRDLAIILYRKYKANLMDVKTETREGVGTAFEQALKLNADNVQLLSLWVRILRDDSILLNEKQRQEFSTAEIREQRADELMDQLVAVRPDDPAAHVVRFMFHAESASLRGVDDDKRLKAEIKVIQQLENLDAATLLFVGNYWESESNRAKNAGESPEEVKAALAEAIASYRASIDKLTSPAGAPYVRLGMALLANNQAAESMAVLESGIKAVGESDFQLNLALCDQLISTDQVDRAEPLLLKMKAKLKRDLDEKVLSAIDLLLARCALFRKEPFNAAKLVRQISVNSRATSSERLNAFILLGGAYASVEQWDQSANAFERALAIDPNHDVARIGAGNSWLRAGQPREAIRHFEYALSRNRSLQTLLTLAYAEISYVSVLPPQQRDWTAFEKMLVELKSNPKGKDLPDHWRIDLLDADFAIIRARESANINDKQLALATKILQDVEQSSPENKALLWELLGRFERQKNSSEADRIVAKLANLLGDSFDRYLLLARFQLQRREFDKARATISDGIAAFPDRRRQLTQLLAQVNISDGKFEIAQKQLLELLEGAPSDLPVLRQLADLSVEYTGRDSGQQRKLFELLEDQFGKLDPDGTSVLFIRAKRLLTEYKNTTDRAFIDAERLQEEIQQRRPNWIMGHRLKAELAIARKSPQQALEALESAVRYGDVRVSTIQQLSALLYQDGRFADADGYLRLLTEFVPNSEQLSSLAISTAANLRDFDRAEGLAQRSVVDRPSDPMAWVWLGHVLRLKERLEESEQAFRKAVDLAPKDARTWQGLFSFLYGTQRTDAARQTLVSIVPELDLPLAQKYFALAQGYALLGDREQAKKNFELAAKSAPENAEVLMQKAIFLSTFDSTLAERDLAQLIKLTQDRSDGQSTATRARRMLAGLLAKREDYDGAIELLKGRDSKADISELDRRLQAVVLAKKYRKNGSSIENRQTLADAQAILEEIIDRKSAIDSDHVLLAWIYQRQAEALNGEEKQLKLRGVRDHLQTVCKRPTPDANHLARFAVFLIEQKDWEECNNTLLTLEAISPRLAILPRAKWLHGQGRIDEISAAVNKLVAKAEVEFTSAPKKALFWSEIGSAVESLGLYDNAESWHRKAFELDPSRVEPLLRTLIQSRKTKEAFEICFPIASKGDSVKIADLLANIVLAGNVPPEQMSVAEPILQKAVMDHPNNVELLVTLGNIRFMQDRHDEARTYYEQAYKLAPKNMLVLNNLASLLAEQPDGRRDALKLIDEAINLYGTDPNLLDTKGMLYVHSDKAVDAVKFLREANSIGGADALRHFHLAVALKRLGRNDEWKKELKIALDNRLSEKLLTKTDRQLLQELQANEGKSTSEQ